MIQAIPCAHLRQRVEQLAVSWVEGQRPPSRLAEPDVISLEEPNRRQDGERLECGGINVERPFDLASRRVIVFQFDMVRRQEYPRCNEVRIDLDSSPGLLERLR